jgi:uncharacterized protein
MTALGHTSEQRQAALDEILCELRSVVVAFSGGVDSAYLALRAHQVLGSKALAVTADSESLAGRQRSLALEVAAQFGFAHRMIRTDETRNPLYVQNDASRCYHCKTELFQKLVPIAQAEGFGHVAYGVIVDDLSDFRPGQRAAAEAGVRSPLAEAGMDKRDVRLLSRALGLKTWDLPASPCLASRLPYGTAVSLEALRQVERAEEALRALGYREFRVRHLGVAARVEIAPDELSRLGEPGATTALEAAVRDAGYASVDVDPEGYRRGRLNEALRVVSARSGV